MFMTLGTPGRHVKLLWTILLKMLWCVPASTTCKRVPDKATHASTTIKGSVQHDALTSLASVQADGTLI